MKKEEQNIIFHNNTNKSRQHCDSFHLSLKGTISLAENFISKTETL